MSTAQCAAQLVAAKCPQDISTCMDTFAGRVPPEYYD